MPNDKTEREHITHKHTTQRRNLTANVAHRRHIYGVIEVRNSSIGRNKILLFFYYISLEIHVESCERLHDAAAAHQHSNCNCICVTQVKATNNITFIPTILCHGSEPGNTKLSFLFYFVPFESEISTPQWYLVALPLLDEQC